MVWWPTTDIHRSSMPTDVIVIFYIKNNSWISMFFYSGCDLQFTTVAWRQFYINISIFLKFQTTVDFRGVRCVDFRFFCAVLRPYHVYPNPPLFSLQGVTPERERDDSKLTSCAAMTCVGKNWNPHLLFIFISFYFS